MASSRPTTTTRPPRGGSNTRGRRHSLLRRARRPNGAASSSSSSNEGGYEAIMELRAQTDEMRAARSRNRDLIFGAAIAPPAAQTTEADDDDVGEVSMAPEAVKKRLEGFRMWKMNDDGTRGEEIFYKQPPPELRFGKTEADELTELIEAPGALQDSAAVDATLPDDADDAARAKADAADKLYDRILAKKRRPAAGEPSTSEQH
mmetsp:Transcript_4755/g.19387  ORF Transcript_4755/g.19387 Transcript_4755/m.19387 type:complete len:204 (-) Transcript_4755:860-1471(-)